MPVKAPVPARFTTPASGKKGMPPLVRAKRPKEAPAAALPDRAVPPPGPEGSNPHRVLRGKRGPSARRRTAPPLFRETIKVFRAVGMNRPLWESPPLPIPTSAGIIRSNPIRVNGSPPRIRTDTFIPIRAHRPEVCRVYHRRLPPAVFRRAAFLPLLPMVPMEEFVKKTES